MDQEREQWLITAADIDGSPLPGGGPCAGTAI